MLYIHFNFFFLSTKEQYIIRDLVKLKIAQNN